MIVILLITASCSVSCNVGSQSGPAVVITQGGSIPFSEDDITQIESGAETWSDLGLFYSDSEVYRNVCAYDWSFTGDTNCDIRVVVNKESGLVELYGVAALSDRAGDSIIFDSRFSGLYLRHLSAHEFGHILLNTSMHLPGKVRGVMSQGSSMVVLSASDIALACVTTSICI